MKAINVSRVSTEEQREASAYKEKREDFDNNVITKTDEIHRVII